MIAFGLGPIRCTEEHAFPLAGSWLIDEQDHPRTVFGLDGKGRDFHQAVHLRFEVLAFKWLYLATLFTAPDELDTPRFNRLAFNTEIPA